MSAPDARTPGGSRADAENTTDQNVVSLPTAEEAGNRKTGRTRYLRLFPERHYFLAEMLNDREIAAWLRLTMAFVVRDGELPVEGLSAITKTGKRWPALRDKLIILGLGCIEDGHWIDADQRANLEIQRRLSMRAVRANEVRWRSRDE